MSSESTKDEDPKGPEWAYKTKLPIQDRMVEVVKLSKHAAEQELAAVRRKLRKIQYGS